MTQIIEEVEVHISPDDWRSVVGMGLKEDWLASKVDEFLASGGTIKHCEVGASTEILEKAYSGFNTVDSKHRDVVNSRRAKRQEAADRSMIGKVDKALNNCKDRTAKELAEELGISVGRFHRILALYFPDDTRQDQMSFGRYKTEKQLKEHAAQIQALYDGGMTGWNNLYRTAGISYSVMKRLHDKGYLSIPKMPNCCGK